MKIAFVALVVLLVASCVLALPSLAHPKVITAEYMEDLVNQMTEKDIEDFCDKIGNNWGPIICRRHQDPALPGKLFKERNAEKLQGATLPPVVLFPGLMGSSLEAQIEKDDVPAWYCFKTADWFRIWFEAEELVVQPCWWDNLQITFVPDNQTYENNPGVLLRGIDFGGIKGIAAVAYLFGIRLPIQAVYSEIISSFEAAGYSVGQNLFGVPYDWRLPADYFMRIGFYTQIQNLIEQAYTNNGNTPVYLITHSMGGPTVLYFLNAMSQAWRDQYVAAFIPIAGPWSGAAKALRAVVSGDDLGLEIGGIKLINQNALRSIARQAGGTVELIPDNVLWPQDQVFVTAGTTTYTVKDFPQLFSDMDSPITTSVWNDVSDILNNLKAPQVTTHCIYGYGVETEINYVYSDVNFNEDPIKINMTDNGDGTVPLASLQDCNDWAKEQEASVFVSEFNLRGHSDILTDSEVITCLLEIVVNGQMNGCANGGSGSGGASNSGTSSGFSGSSGLTGSSSGLSTGSGFSDQNKY